MGLVLFFQLLAFAVAGAALYYVAGIEMSRDIYSAHRTLRSAQQSLLPAMAVGGALGFLLVAVSTWLVIRSCAHRFDSPLRRADLILQRLAQGRLSSAPAPPPGRSRTSLDDSADEVVAAFAHKASEIQQTARKIHNAVLALRYKATGSDPLTLKELRETTGNLDLLCKRLANVIKWFET